MEPIIASAAAVAAGAYLNAKLSIGVDFKQLKNDRQWGQRLGAIIQGLGDTCTLYRMFERVESENEALWFEGKTWTYRELKYGEFFFSALLD